MYDPLTIRSIYGAYNVKFDNFETQLKTDLRDGDVVLVDSNVSSLYPLIDELIASSNKIIVQPSERAKEYGQLADVIESIVETGFSRNNRLIAIGGGVTQDITGFISSILFRGVPWRFYPTNLLSQCDSCIGSKTSINFREYKNQLGNFYPPEQIVIDFRFLETLPKKDVFSGLGEMLHYFLVDGQESLKQIGSEIQTAIEDYSTLPTLVVKSLKIKQKMVELDEFDRGPRNVFNYGHSFGHALESVTDYAVPHGIAVAFGMDLANVISARNGLIPMSLRNDMRQIIAPVWSETSLSVFDVDNYLLALSKDKKNVGKQTKVILTKGPGLMFKSTLAHSAEVIDLIDSYFRLRQYEKNL